MRLKKLTFSFTPLSSRVILKFEYIFECCCFNSLMCTRLVALFTSVELLWLVHRTIWVPSLCALNIPLFSQRPEISNSYLNLVIILPLFNHNFSSFNLLEINIKVWFYEVLSRFRGWRRLEEREKIKICKGQSSPEILPPTPTAIFQKKILPAP